jgi:REP element-mobilizing transposase RayT
VVRRRTRGYLPHWERDQGIYFITFRLADSLPAKVLKELREHRRLLAAAKASGRRLLPVESVLARRLERRRIEEYLDAGSGACILKRPEVAAIAAGALRFWDGERYDLAAWCVMPNHVHVVGRFRPGWEMALTVQGWKSYTSRRINLVLERRGTVWQKEPYDHLIRNRSELARAIAYVRDNPTRAGLKDWPWVYVKDDFEWL